MKKLLLILLLLPVLSIAQTRTLPLDSGTKNVVFQEVVKVDGVSKDELYIRAREWFARTFKSAKDVIQMEDKAAGKIIGKGSSRGYNSYLLAPGGFYLDYTVSVTAKDGRFRYEISDFSVLSDPSKYVTNPTSVNINSAYSDDFYRKKDGSLRDRSKDYFIEVLNSGDRLSSSLKTAMSKIATGAKSKDDF